MRLADVPAWVWQTMGAVGGIALGVFIGSWRQDDRDRARRKARAAGRPASSGASRLESVQTQGASSQLASQLQSLPVSAGEGEAEPLHTHLPGSPESPQERLMARMAKANRDLEAQVRAGAARHSRLLKSKDEAIEAVRAECEGKLEDLRKAHADELKYLMKQLLQEVERLTKHRADYVATLEAEVERMRGVSNLWQAEHPGERVEEATVFAPTEPMKLPPA